VAFEIFIMPILMVIIFFFCVWLHVSDLKNKPPIDIPEMKLAPPPQTDSRIKRIYELLDSRLDEVHAIIRKEGSLVPRMSMLDLVAQGGTILALIIWWAYTQIWYIPPTP
jgi:hypothetical protein